jgi:MFS family permease
MAVFFTPLVQEFGWTRAALSGAFSIARLEAGIAGPLAGICIDRWGPRRMMVLGLILMSVGFVLLSRVESLEAFYLIFLLFLSLGTGFGVMPPITTAVTNWFYRRRSLATGLLMCGAGVGGFAASSLGWLITAYGWRQTLVFVGIFVIVTGVPGVLLLRHRPEPYGLRPDGDPPAPVSSARAATAPNDGFLPSEALRVRAFYGLAFIFGARHVTTSGTLVHLPALMVDRGFTLEAAATLAGVVALVSIPGRVLCGWLGDRVDKRYVFAACLLFMVIGIAALALGSSPGHLGVFTVAYGMAYGGSVPLTVSIVADYFGRRRFATVYGLSQFAMMWGTISGPMIAGYAFDTTGSYQVALNIFMAVGIVGTVGTLLVRPPRLPGRVTGGQGVPA